MPAAYEATLSGNPTPPTWTSATGFGTGDLVQPSTPTGQYFMCQNNGATGGSEPNWADPTALPVPGTTYPDGSTNWICVGSFVADTGAIVVDIPLDSDPSIVAATARALKNLANQFLGIYASAHNWTAVQNFTVGINCEDTGSNGTAIGFTGKNGTNDPGINGTGGSTGFGAIINGGPVFGGGVWGIAQGGNSPGIRGDGFGDGPGGTFTGGGGNADGVDATGNNDGVGGSFTGGSTGFSGTAGAGVVGVGGANGGVGGDFTAGAAGNVGVAGHGVGFAGVLGDSDVGPGGQFKTSANGARSAIHLNPFAGVPSAPQEGDFTYDGNTHKAYIYDGTTYQPLW